MTRSTRALALVLACCVTPALRASTLDPGAVFAVAEDDYQKGTTALDQQRWQDAVTDFDRVIAAKNKRSDAALYWKAYALNKMGRTALVRATCDQLRATYSASTWNRDCTALTLNSSNTVGDPGIFRGAPGDGQNTIRRIVPQPNDEGIYRGDASRRDERSSPSRLDGAGSDADLKMLALNSVLRRDPAQAIPVIRDILNGSGSQEMKHRALSVLGMSQSPEAQTLLRDVATGKVAPSEQRQAISMLGVFQGKRANDTLSEVYRTTSDRSIKRAVISAFFISQDAPRMVELARNEKDLSLKHDIVAQLALMKDKAATDYMLELLK